MDLSDLTIFRAVVREGGITRAAEHLNRVQSNVTTRIRQLEEDLQVPLFIREGKRLHLAPAGKILLGYADRLLALAEEAQSAIRDPHPRGVFRLGSMESTAAVRLPALLSEYGARYPKVQLELRTGTPTELSTSLLNGELDAALVAEPVAEARFESLPAFVEKTIIVTGADFPDINLDDGVPKTMLVFENGCPHRRLLEAWYASRGDMPERIVELTSYHAMLGCVIAGMGAALLPESVLCTFPEAKRLVRHPLPEGMNRLKTFLIWRKDATSPNVEALADIIAKDPQNSLAEAS
ncbi:LysR family transcriptional regulator [Sneathiella chungangensis]|uniref:LysR family transcriptional regulator n=1 Tax=Sneathiella chungangensis TaxID=1418234 RepID=A0A845MCH4_9PROT|nr:LysR family transcriptional regulator [Sneathiella chungangensis]MZR21415.1 LysR family transcriptional regulator [Sneathiella chungangensis]